MGAFPVFVVDGETSPLKSQARAARFSRGSGVDPPASSSAEAEGAASAPAPVKARNAIFTRCVKDCVVSAPFLQILFSLYQDSQFSFGSERLAEMQCFNTT